MAADLDPVGVRPTPVGAVDDRGREPEHALGDLVEDLVFARRRGGQRPVIRSGRAHLHRRFELVEFVVGVLAVCGHVGLPSVKIDE